MKKLIIEIFALCGMILLICLIARGIMGNVYTIYLPIHNKATQLGSIKVLDAQGNPAADQDPHSQILTVEHAEIHDGHLQASFRAMREGQASFEVTDQDGKALTELSFRVGKLHSIWFENTMGFTGDLILLAGIAAACLLSAFLMIRYFIRCRGSELFSYHSMYVLGFAVFILAIGILMLCLTLGRALKPEQFFTYSSYSVIAFSGFLFLMATAPLVLLFCLLLFISNIELLRHERKRFANVLGILLSLILAGGVVLSYILYNQEFTGSVLQQRIRLVLINVYAASFAYFECMLLSAIICGLRSVRQKAAMDKDFIIILGCGFRKDGSLTPLLKGRVDKAVSFWKMQKKETGKTAVFIPSGGQGANEKMPEAEAMTRYLETECKIPPALILKETQSANTYQNMAFSKRIIEQHCPDQEAKVLFSTTNYHVFRSGVWATLAGLETEGIGSKTKWWFWPNAFIRECVGLMRNRIKLEIIQLLLFVAIFCFLSLFVV